MLVNAISRNGDFTYICQYCLNASEGMMMMMMMIFFFVVWLTDEGHSSFFPAGTIARDPHHRESSTLHEQDFKLLRT